MNAEHTPAGDVREPADPPTRRGERRRIRVRKRRRWYRRRLARRRILWGVTIMAGLLLADGAWATVGLARGLVRARSSLTAGAEALVAGRLGDARASFEEAGEAASGAAGSLWHPAAMLVDVIPGIGDDVDAVEALAASAQHLARAGNRLVDAAEASGWDGNSVPGIQPTRASQGETEDDREAGRTPNPGGRDRGTPERPERTRPNDRQNRSRADRRGADRPGSSEFHVPIRVRLRVVRLASPHLADAAAAVSAAERALQEVDDGGLMAPVREALTEARAEVAPRAHLLKSMADLTELLPGFLGGDEARRYFLAFQNLSAPRGSGGFMGVYGLLEAKDGRLELERMAGVQELGRTEKVQAPPDYMERYGRFGGLDEFFAVNYSPDFPTTGGILLDLYEASGRGRLDGVIAVDPIWGEYALRAAGPIRTNAWPEPLTAENISRILHHDVFLLDKQASDAAQIGIGKALIEGLLDQPLNPRMLADALSQAARERHLQVYAEDAGEQELLDRLAASGDVTLGANPLYVVWQDATTSKTGYFAHRWTEHTVTLTPDGTARVTSVITLDNRAPSGPPSVLLGNGREGDPVGTFAAFVSVYLPEDATRIQAKVPGSFALDLVEREFEHPVAMELLAARAGGQRQLVLTYEVPNAVRDMGDAVQYRLDFLPQPLLRPEAVTIEVTLPPGAVPIAVAPGMEAGDGTATFEGEPTGPRSFWVSYRRSA